MVEKRPLDDPETYNVISSAKHARHSGDEPGLFSEFVPSTENASPRQPRTAAGGGFMSDKMLEEDINAEISIAAGDIKTPVLGSNDFFSWASKNTVEEDYRSETPVRASFIPDHSSPDHPLRMVAQYEDIYSILLHHLPHKSVAIGPNHQADIPECIPLGAKDISHHPETSEAELTAGDNYDRKLMGTCVIPMLHSEPSAWDSNKVGSGRTDCSCSDEGSVRCVKQHVMEAREKLRQALGLEIFVELGFCNLGEQVAQKWSLEEEQLFHEVIFSNPASLGKNFWHNLSAAFPLRTNKDIVSYYFNVFMLRRRAEQNRCDTMNIDSDNDEWQGTDDYGDNEPEMSEEDEDSVVESPVYQDNPAYARNGEDDLNVYEEVTADENGCEDETVNFDWVRETADNSETYPGKFLNCGSNPTSQHVNKTPWHERFDQDVQDDSCTSTDTAPYSEGTQLKDDSGNHCPDRFDGLSSGQGHEYVLEPSDAKVWDSNSGCLSCLENKIDFLPTCSMIEEVFGDELLGRDGKNSS